MLRLMVVDDEPPARRGLKRLVQAHADAEIVGEAGTLMEAERLARALQPDAIFLDIEFANDEGFRLIEVLDPVPAIVFVTAHGAYAPKAFDVGALDFMLKPVSPERLALTLDRLRRRKTMAAPDRLGIAPVAPAGDLPAGLQGRRLHIRMAGQSIMAATDDIAMLAAEADFTRIVMTDAREYLICKLLRLFDAELPRPPFCRISRSLIVNLHRLEWLKSEAGGRSLLSLGPRIAPVVIGRAASRRLRRHVMGGAAGDAPASAAVIGAG